MFLELDQVSKSFGGLMAVRAMSVTVAPGEIVGLIGPNGAGKTTLFNLISGFYKMTRGESRFGNAMSRASIRQSGANTVLPARFSTCVPSSI